MASRGTSSNPLSRPVPRVAVILPAILAGAATCPSLETRVFPQWEIQTPPPRVTGCALVTAWVVRSGKEGVAITLELDTEQPRCDVELKSATLKLPSRAVPAALRLPPAMELVPGAARHAWLAFPFDGDQAWNDGERTATLQVSQVVAGEPHPWTLELVNRLEGGQLIDPLGLDRQRDGGER